MKAVLADEAEGFGAYLLFALGEGGGIKCHAVVATEEFVVYSERSWEVGGG